MHNAGIERGSNEIVRSSDGMNIACEMEVEIFHRNDLRITAASSAALDAKGRSHGGLTDGSDDLSAEVRAKRLRKTYRGGRLAFAERGWGNGSHIHVNAIRFALEAFQNFKFDLGFVGSKQLKFIVTDSEFLRDLCNGFEFTRLRDLNI